MIVLTGKDCFPSLNCKTYILIYILTLFEDFLSRSNLAHKLLLTKLHKFQHKKYLGHVKDGIELKEINIPIDYDVIDALTLIQEKLESPVFLKKNQSFDSNSLSSLSTSGMLESGASSFQETLSMAEFDKLSMKSQETVNCLDPSLPYSLMLLGQLSHQLEELKDGIEHIENGLKKVERQSHSHKLKLHQTF